jgi:integrase
MPTKPLTQRIIDTMPTPTTGYKELRERGLVLRISAAGARSWSFEYRSPIPPRKNARISFEATSLADARAIVHRYRVTLHEGKDPNQDRKDAVEAQRVEYARTSITVREVIEKYEQPFLQKSPNKAKSRRNRMVMLRRILASSNERPVASLTRREMIGLLDSIQEVSGPIARNRAHAEIRAWLGWAHKREYAPSNVLDGLEMEVSETDRARTRVFTDAEIVATVSGTADGSIFSDIVRVLLHTGMRRNEVASLQPRDLDFETRTIRVRPEVDKIKRGRLVPMVDAIAPMLKARIEGLSREAYIFGEGSRYTAPFIGWDDPLNRLRASMPEGEHWAPHDIRRTVATRLHDAGVDALVIEDLLGHKGVRSGVAGVYNRSVTLPKQREALSAWAVRLAALGGNVVPFKRIA